MSENAKSEVRIINEKTDELKENIQTTAEGQYRLCVEMADKISERRNHANNFYLGINSASLVLVGYLIGKDTVTLPTFFYIVLCIAGLAITLLWYTQIESYRNLNTAKFIIIQEMEKHLPFRPYSAEWELVEEGKNKKLYQPLSHIEMKVPLVFSALYLLAILWLIPWKSCLPHCLTQ